MACGKIAWIFARWTLCWHGTGCVSVHPSQVRVLLKRLNESNRFAIALIIYFTLSEVKLQFLTWPKSICSKKKWQVHVSPRLDRLYVCRECCCKWYWLKGHLFLWTVIRPTFDDFLGQLGNYRFVFQSLNPGIGERPIPGFRDEKLRPGSRNWNL